jgi:hypothetical protein
MSFASESLVSVILAPDSIEPRPLRNRVSAVLASVRASASLDDATAQTTCFALLDGKTEELLGAICGAPAEVSPLASRIRTREQSLSSCYYLGPAWLHPSHGTDLAPLLLYMAIRQARRARRTMLLADIEGGARVPSAPQAILGSEATAGPAGKSGAAAGPHLPAWETHRAAYKAFSAMTPALQAWAADNLLVEELEGTVRDRADQFFRTAFFQRIFDRALTRSQYIESVANNHQFVRWTTRLLGRMVGLTVDPVLRRHYVEHLKGEIDHEVLLENDLRYLGADVEYVKQHMAPCVEIQQFMVVQESMAAFHSDPVLFLAVPFAIEAGTAFMDQGFIEALRACISGWGYSSPGRGCTFLSSHIKTDGGDDGHWQATRKMLRLFVRDEYVMPRALNTAHLVMDGVTRAYEAYGNRPAVERFELVSVPRS